MIDGELSQERLAMALLQQLVEKRRLSFDKCFDGYHAGYTKMGMISDAWDSYFFFLGFLLLPFM